MVIQGADKYRPQGRVIWLPDFTKTHPHRPSLHQRVDCIDRYCAALDYAVLSWASLADHCVRFAAGGDSLVRFA